ncbi:MAG: PQQ-binding-like beta-propeller repeat protein [Acidobacteriota bacterium]
MRRTLFLVSLGLLVVGVSCAVPGLADAVATDWPQYRGQHRDGVSAETGLIRSWPETGPTELWRRSIGAAFSSIAVRGNHLYTTEVIAAADENAGQIVGEFALKLQVADGSIVWRRPIGERFENNFGDGPRTTPTLDGEQLFLLSGSGRLVSLEDADGSELWAVDLGERFGAELPHFGWSTSPIVVDDHLIVEVGAPDGHSVVAFDKSTGEVAWHVGDDGGAYGSPIRTTLAGVDQLVFVNRFGVVGLGLDGAPLWRHEWASSEGVKPALPILFGGDRLLVSASYDIGAMALQVKATEDGLTTEELWSSRVLRNHFNSSVLSDGKVYGFDNASLKCIEPASGDTLWVKRGGLGKGSLILADGMLIVLTERGTLKLVEARSDAYTELASASVLSGRCWTSPTLSDGRLFLRNREEMVVLDLEEASLMHRFGWSLILMLGWVVPTAADTTPAEAMTAETVVARTIEALGGAEALAAVRSVEARGTMDINGIEQPFVIRYHGTNYRLDLIREGGPDTVEAFDGETSWVAGGRRNPAPRRLDGLAAQLVAEESGAFGPLVGAEAAGHEVELVGEADLDGEAVWHLRLTRSSERAEDWYVDRSSFLPARRVSTAVHRRRGEYPRQLFMIEWQAFDGPKGTVRFPVYLEREDSQHVRAFTIEDVALNPEIDSALFTPPPVDDADGD